ncbi:MAG: hypothetical protein U5K84_07260 [Alkalibacterium sp.]|nr:hypothetical protein [Alkalibacterium sp.]
MIGSIFFSISYFLFSVVGTYLMIITSGAFSGSLTFFQFSYRELFDRIRSVLKAVLALVWKRIQPVQVKEG